MTILILILNAINLLANQQHFWQEQTTDDLHSKRQWFRMDKKGNIWRSNDLTSWINITRLLPGKPYNTPTPDSQEKHCVTYATQPTEPHLSRQPRHFYTVDGNLLLLED